MRDSTTCDSRHDRKLTLLSSQVAKTKADRQRNSQTDLHLTFYGPIRPSDVPQRASLTRLDLVCIEKVRARHDLSLLGCTGHGSSRLVPVPMSLLRPFKDWWPNPVRYLKSGQPLFEVMGADIQQQARQPVTRKTV